MARKIQSRLRVTGDLIAETPIHVGGINNELTVDLALAVNGQGQFYIPGTSLAGILRGWMGEDSVTKALWGFQERNGKESKGNASYVSIKDAVVHGVESEIRDGVGIDRYYGAAADQAKFDRAILPKGSRIPLDMTVEQKTVEQGQQNTVSWEDCKAALKALLQALQQQEVRLGAAKTRGLGRVKLENLAILEQDFSKSDGIIAILREQGTSVSLEALSSPARQNQCSRLEITIHWEPVGPLMVKATADGIAVDTLPLTSAVGDHLTFVLPGSAIKGCLRSQAERIVRTVRSLPVLQNSHLKPGEQFTEQLQQVPLIQELFGAASRFSADGSTQKRRQRGQQGALAVDDCYATKLLVSPSQWREIETATSESQLRTALNAANLAQTQQAFHVAIDRWTGGAAENFLYSALEPFGVSWAPIQLTLCETPRLKQMGAGIALTLLVLRDLAAGRIPLGYATNRGMGAIRVTNVTLSGRGFKEELESLNSEISLPQGNLLELGELLTTLNIAWTNWLDTPAAGETQ